MNFPVERMRKIEEHGLAGLAHALRCWLYQHLVIEPIGLVLRGLRHLPRNNLDKQGIEVIRGCYGLDIVGCDLVEVAPIYDVSGMTSRIAADLIYEMLCVLPGVERREG